MEKFTNQPASASDIPTLVDLINHAYRGGGAAAGWTSEEQFLDGERTNEKSVGELLGQTGAEMLKWEDRDGKLAACVYLQLAGRDLHLGTFAVSPSIQAQGLGKQILLESEAYAARKGCNRIVITVLSVRKELIDWYVRRGFAATDKRIPLPSAKFGVPKVEVDFIEMAKKVG